MNARRDTWTLRLAAGLYLSSGVAALVYQSAWQRILALYTGVGLYSIAVIVAVFMAGLGAGSHLGGVWSARLGRRGALRGFAAVELAIGAFGAASPWVYYDWLYPIASGLPVPSWPAALMHVAALGPPTLLMGVSLPFLTRAVVPDLRRAGRSVGLLYALNMAGAGLGALATPWFLVPQWGIRGALVGAGALSLLVGAGGWALLRRLAEGPEDATPEPPRVAAGVDAPSRQPFALWLSLYGFSGFLALSLEIVWFRILDVAVKSTAFTFGTVLSIYLLSSAAGCLVSTFLVDRVRQPLRVFLILQCALMAATAGGMLVLVHNLPNESFYRAYWQGYDFFAFGQTRDDIHLRRLYVHLPLILFGLPTALMGAAFPVLQRAVHDDLRSIGRKVGLLQAANIAGCVAGSLLVGLLAVDRLGTAATFRLLVLGALAFSILGWRRYGRGFAVSLGALLALAAALPDSDALWRRLHGLPATARALFDEDATGVVAITEETVEAKGWRFRLSLNGKGNSWFPFGGPHTVMGAVPAIVHPAPRRVAIVGLGSGDTAWAAACRPETESVTVVELSGPQPRALRRLLALEPLPDLARLIGDPRLELRIADGRQMLQSEHDVYDIVQADAIWPNAAYSGNLYSLEFFRLVASRLAPGGIACTWAPTPRVRTTFLRVFPHVLEVPDGSLLLGSERPLVPRPGVWERRLSRSTDYLGQERADLIRQRLTHLAPAGPAAHLQPNLDLFPRDEFAVRER